MRYYVMRQHFATWEDPGDDDILSEWPTKELALAAREEAEGKHPGWSLWLACGDDEDEANGDLHEITEHT